MKAVVGRIPDARALQGSAAETGAVLDVDCCVVARVHVCPCGLLLLPPGHGQLNGGGCPLVVQMTRLAHASGRTQLALRHLHDEFVLFAVLLLSLLQL